MKLIKHRLSPATVIALIALFVALGGVGVAATGGNFILGQSNNAGNTTALSSGVTTGPTLSLTNTGGKPAARFAANSGVAPFSVGSAAKVANLNADQLDGFDSGYFLPKTGKAANADKLDGIDSTGFVQGTTGDPIGGDPPSTGKTLFSRRTVGSIGSNTNFLYMPGLGHFRLDCNADNASLEYVPDTSTTTTVYWQVNGSALGRATTSGSFGFELPISSPQASVLEQGGFGQGAGAKLFTATFMVDRGPTSGSCFVQGSALVQTS
jgi:hypothetical protein